MSILIGNKGIDPVSKLDYSKVISEINEFKQSLELSRSDKVFTDFQKLTGFSGLTFLGGVAGCGKTTLACQVANAAILAGYPVLFLSFEMTKAMLIERLAINAKKSNVINTYIANCNNLYILEFYQLFFLLYLPFSVASKSIY